MKASSGDLHLSASDLSNHLACRHLTSLDFGVAIGDKSAPTWYSPDLWVLQKRGLEHESAYVDHLSGGGLLVLDLRNTSEQDAITAVQKRDATRRRCHRSASPRLWPLVWTRRRPPARGATGQTRVVVI